ncbi:CHAT domain-containing protein [Bacteroidota bacterium]
MKAFAYYIFGLIVFICIGLLISCKTPSVIATESIYKGDQMNNESRYDEAILYYEQYLSTVPALGVYRNHSMEADVCRKLAHAYSTQGNYSKSLNYLNKALSIDTLITDNKLEVIEDYRQRGIINSYMGDFEKAIIDLSRSLELSEGMEASLKSDKRLSMADTYMSMAQINFVLGNFKEAETFANEALLLYEMLPNEYAGKIEAFLLIGNIYLVYNEPEKSIEYLNKSKETAMANDLNTARQDQGLGEASVMRGLYEDGLRFKLNALKEAEKSNIKPQIVWANVRLGDMYKLIGEEDRANQYYNKASQLQEEFKSDSTGLMPSLEMRLGNVQQAQNYFLKMGVKTGAALASLRLGDMAFENEDYESAHSYYHEAHVLYNEMNIQHGIYQAILAKNEVMIKQENFKSAEKEINIINLEQLSPELEWQYLFQKGQIEEANGNYNSAKSFYDIAIGLVEEIRGSFTLEEFKTSFVDSKMDVYDHMIHLLMQHGNNLNLNLNNQKDPIALAFEYNEQARSRSFLDMLGNRKVEPLETADEEILEEERLIRVKIQHLTRELQKKEHTVNLRKQLQYELDDALEYHESLVQRIKLNSIEYSCMVGVDPPDLLQIQNGLDNNIVLVEFWVGEHGTCAWLIDRNHFRGIFIDTDREWLKKQIIASRRLIKMQVTGTTEQILSEMFDRILKPFEDELKGFDYVCILPHRELHFLPFHALITSSGKYLVEEHDIYISPSSSVHHLCNNREKAKGTGFLGFALGEKSIGNFNGLPGTEREIDHIGQIYDDFDKRTSENFDETGFKSMAGKYRYLHIATHGVINEKQPMYSYLLLVPSDVDDGQLTVNEIFGLRLNCQQVTLSACETGLGDLSEGDDLVGLSRAFIYAGTPMVVVSLWTVDDVTTAILMTRFYQYLDAGYKPSSALSSAQRDIINNSFEVAGISEMQNVSWDRSLIPTVRNKKDIQHRNPYFWAPFVVIGDGI